MQERPLVTIVTITLDLIKAGREKFFRQCVESVHDQTYKNIEHIVIDGASKDGTFDLIKEYADKGWIKYVSVSDTGIYNAMNKGINLANGKYITFLHSDDFYHNIDAVNLSVKSLEGEQADFSCANFILINGNKKEIVRGEIEKFLYTMPFGHPTMFTKKTVLDAENGFNEKYRVAADYDLIIRLILKDYKGVYINAETTSYRFGGICCTTDYSDEIAQIYINNYSSFYDFLDVDQAKKIMYELKLPDEFMANFRDYANKNKYKNINIDKIIESLMNNLVECKEKNDFSIADDKNKKGIPVFLSGDNNYAPFVATTICSIMDNTNSFVDFYILDGGISSKNVERIKAIKKMFPNFSIEFIEINTEKNFKNFPTRRNFSIDMYNRYLIPELKPELKKVIYSDADVIFNDDINELLNENLDGHIIGAVPYSYGYLYPGQEEIKSFHKRLKLSMDHTYFESGLLLIDIDLWRKNKITEKLIEETKNKPCDMILTPDQDVFNIVFKSSYQQLDNKYIVVPHRIKLMLTSSQMRKSVEKPFIIHYAGLNKPWDNPKIELADYFWKYARMTSFYEEMLYDLMNNVGRKQKNIFNTEMAKVVYNNFVNKIRFVIFSPKKFIKKYF